MMKTDQILFIENVRESVQFEMYIHSILVHVAGGFYSLQLAHFILAKNAMRDGTTATRLSVTMNTLFLMVIN